MFKISQLKYGLEKIDRIPKKSVAWGPLLLGGEIFHDFHTEKRFLVDIYITVLAEVFIPFLVKIFISFGF